MVARQVGQQLLDEQHDDEGAEQGIAHLEAGQLLGIERHVAGIVHLVIDAGELAGEIGRRVRAEVAFAGGRIDRVVAAFDGAVRGLELHFVDAAFRDVFEFGGEAIVGGVASMATSGVSDVRPRADPVAEPILPGWRVLAGQDEAEAGIRICLPRRRRRGRRRCRGADRHRAPAAR